MLFVSAFWHGVHPGYYVTIMSVPLMILAEKQMGKLIKPYLNAKQLYYYDWLSWFCLFRTFDYLSVGFIMLKLDVVWTIFKSNYFIGHIIMVLFTIVPMLIPKKSSKVSADREKEKATFKAD